MAKLRLFRLGSLEHKIYPTKAAIQKLTEILRTIDGKEDVDLVWGPDIEVLEFEIGPNDMNVVKGLDIDKHGSTVVLGLDQNGGLTINGEKALQ